MTQHVLWALAAFAFVTSITPGPNNLMLMASGANFGLRRTLPHMFGISLGHMLLVICTGLGLGQLFVLYPSLQIALRVIGGVYLLYLAWKLATGAGPHQPSP